VTDPIATARKLFSNPEWTVEEIPVEDGVIFEVRIGDPDSNGETDLPLLGIVGHVDTDEQRFVMLFEFDRAAPPDLHDEVVRAITLANFGLPMGRFEFDYESGRVRFSHGLSFAGAELSYELAENQFEACAETIDIYGWHIAAVMDGELSAIEAIEQAESEQAEDE